MLIEPNAETVEAVLDTAWRVTESEWALTDSLDRKAASVATFAALAVAVAARNGATDAHRGATELLYLIGLCLLIAAIAAAVWALVPKERRGLGISYLESLTRWPQLTRGRAEVQGDLAVTLFETVVLERASNRRKTLAVRAAFVLLVLGLAAVTTETSIILSA